MTLKTKEYTYEGATNAQGLPHGKGKMVFSNGRIWEGSFKNGSLNGEGKITHPDGTIDEGSFVNGRLHGNGRRTFPDGMIRSGSFCENELVRGFLIYPLTSVHALSHNSELDGVIFHEGFSGGEPTGEGRIEYPDGMVDEGEISFYKLHGSGRRTYPDGALAIGEFTEGVFVNGKITYPSGELCEGEFKDKFLHGRGVRTLSDGTIIRGDFSLNELTKGSISRPNGITLRGSLSLGKGRLVSEDGFAEEGAFKGGYLHGKGKKTKNGAVVEEGEFVEGVIVKGKRILPDGTTEMGKFENGLLHGEGLVLHSDKKRVEGFFEAGELVFEKPHKITGKDTYIGSKSAKGEPHGAGTMYYANGTIYKGNWCLGSWHGRGIYFEGDISYQGVWSDTKVSITVIKTDENGLRTLGGFKNGAFVPDRK